MTVKEYIYIHECHIGDVECGRLIQKITYALSVMYNVFKISEKGRRYCEGPLLSLLLSYTDLGLSLYFGSVTKFAYP